MTVARPGTRRTFVVQIHADGAATVENLRTRERVPIAAMSVLGDQINAWLAEDGAPATKGEGRGGGHGDRSVGQKHRRVEGRGR
jgi:hypothetical protein